MKYNLLISIIYLFLLSACGKAQLKQGETIINVFYSNAESENYKALDTLMSFQFYQGTPYKQFVQMINNKNKVFGKINKKSLGKYKIVKSTNSTDTIHLGYIVDYQKAHTKESFTLIKENKDFKILKYYISQEDN